MSADLIEELISRIEAAGAAELAETLRDGLARDDIPGASRRPVNNGVTISTPEPFRMFPNQESARLYLESRLWPNGVKCPVCASGERVAARKGGYYRCNACAEDFTVRTGTIFERSHVPLHKWLYSMYLLLTARKGISSIQLSKEIGITQKSAWFVLHRLREACGDDLAHLQVVVEIVGKVLSYRPKPKSKPAKRRVRRAKKAKRP